jgi:TRAP-type C4-dicarboxylate transport system substrate-binding protein
LGKSTGAKLGADDVASCISASLLENAEKVMIKSVLCAVITVLLTAPLTSAQEATNSRELVVAAAADPSSALQEVAERYRKRSGVKVKLSFRASGSAHTADSEWSAV